MVVYMIVIFRLVKTIKKIHKHFSKPFIWNAERNFIILRKNIFVGCLFNIHNIISLLRREEVCLIRLRFERYFPHHRGSQKIMLRILIANMRTWVE